VKFRGQKPTDKKEEGKPHKPERGIMTYTSIVANHYEDFMCGKITANSAINRICDVLMYSKNRQVIEYAMATINRIIAKMPDYEVSDYQEQAYTHANNVLYN
jgi:hypothetical protein